MFYPNTFIRSTQGIIRYVLSVQREYTNLQILDDKDSFFVGTNIELPTKLISEEYAQVTEGEFTKANISKCECGAWITGSRPKTKGHSQWCWLFDPT